MRTRPEEDRELAEMLYVVEGKNPGEIATRLGMNRMTIWRWAKDGDWKTRRAARWRTSPRVALDLLKRQRELQIQKIPDGVAAPPEVIEALHQLNRIIEQMEEPLVGPGALLDVMHRFAKFVVVRATDEGLEEMRGLVDKFLEKEEKDAEG